MNWNEIIREIIYWLLGLVGTGATAFFTYFINKRIKDKDLKAQVSATVKDCVLDVYQTYVEALKDKNVFDKDAQKEALATCLTLIKRNLPTNALIWLNKIYNDVDSHLRLLIESQIAQEKKEVK